MKLTATTLELNSDEREELLHLVERAVDKLDVEINRTDSADFKADLVWRRRKLDGIRTRLGDA